MFQAPFQPGQPPGADGHYREKKNASNAGNNENTLF
jgi:hypothetical protein